MFEHAFELLAAFDEIVALGYKENVNLAQIRTYTEMDSHDERVHDAMRQVRSKSIRIFHPAQCHCSSVSRT